MITKGSIREKWALETPRPLVLGFQKAAIL